jgi:hypothetical protein
MHSEATTTCCCTRLANKHIFYNKKTFILEKAQRIAPLKEVNGRKKVEQENM